eukprot:Nk52_evm11s578 gene=Nk52_evmTU11s578
MNASGGKSLFMRLRLQAGAGPQHQQFRSMSVLKTFMDNVKKGMEKSVKESSGKKTTEAASTKSQTSSSSTKNTESAGQQGKTLGEHYKGFIDSLKNTANELKSSSLAKEGKRVAETVAESTSKAAEEAKKASEQVAGESLKNPVVKKVSEQMSEGLGTVKQEIFKPLADASSPYKGVRKLKRRTDLKKKAEKMGFEKPVAANDEAQGVVLHKDSKFFEQWNNFKDNNKVVQGMFDLKMKFDESDNLFVRNFRAITERVTDSLGGAFAENEMAEVLSEVMKIDPTFTKDNFLALCERDIIPTILEAYNINDMEILEDWCTPPCFSVISANIEHQKSQGLTKDCKILDIRHVDIPIAKMMEQGPMLIVTFVAQQTLVFRDRVGQVVEGDPDKVTNCYYVLAMCRDQTILDPYEAWRVMEFGIQDSQETW